MMMMIVLKSPIRPLYEDDHHHVDSSHSTTVFSNSYTPISGATMSNGIAVSDIALSISQPPVQRYVKFPTTMINGKFNSNTTSVQHVYEDDHHHVDSSHSTTVFSNSYTSISGATMSNGIAVSNIALSISQPPVQRYVKFPTTMINGKFNSNWYTKYSVK